MKPHKHGYPSNPHTLGEHIKKARMAKGLLQKAVAGLLDVCEDTITGWENGRSYPQKRYYPAIALLIGYIIP